MLEIRVKGYLRCVERRLGVRYDNSLETEAWEGWDVSRF